MAEFDPRELDRLEDALDSIAPDGADVVASIDALELAPELTARLHEYREILALCREAFPDEAPPEGALADVLAEAREVSRRPKLRDLTGEGASGWRRFWERWRGTLVPGFALAGTAAAVLWLLDPGGDGNDASTLLREDPTGEHADRAERAPDPSNPASETKRDDAKTEARAIDDSDGDSPRADGDDEPAADDDGHEREPTSKGGKSKTKPQPAVAPEPVPEPPPEPLGKDETWSVLDRAHAARLAGDCTKAISLYREVIEAGTVSQAIGRAHGGVGLCYEQQGKNAGAESWFDQARTESPGVDAWLEQQRDEQPLPGAKSKKKHSKKNQPMKNAASSDALEQAL